MACRWFLGYIFYVYMALLLLLGICVVGFKEETFEEKFLYIGAIIFLAISFILLFSFVAQVYFLWMLLQFAISIGES